jgi:hypothetical protein
MSPLAPGESTLAAHLEAGPLRADAVARIGVHAARELTASPLTATSRREFCPAAIHLDPSPEGGLDVAVRSPSPPPGTRPSPMYRSPEQVTHASTPDARSDVYSLSMVLYEALSGKLPLPRCATESELLTTLVTHESEPLTAAAPWLDPKLCRVVERGLEREPGRRWPSLAELGDALAPFMGESEHISADMLEGITAGDRIPRVRHRAVAAPRRRGRRLVPAAATAGVLILASLVWWVRSRDHAFVESARPVSPALPAAEKVQLYSKKQVATALLEGTSFFIHLDPRRPGVLVPEKFRAQPQLVLQVGKQLATPIPDLVIDDAGITATLSFSQKPFFCRVPWPAVYALLDEAGRGQLWAEDVPPEVVAEMAKKNAAGDAGAD